MTFVDDRFSVNAEYGSSGGAEWNTAVVEVASGAEERTARWSIPRHRYNAAYGVKTHDALYTLKQFWMARQGALVAFPWKDWSDFTTATNGRDAYAYDDENIGTGDGSDTTFQLVKRYTSGGVTHVRNLTKPVTGAVKVGVNGSEVTMAGNWTVDRLTGIVTFTTPPTAGHQVTAGCEFDVPVRFEGTAGEQFNIAYNNFGTGGVEPFVGLVEDLTDDQFTDEVYLGGSSEQAFSADLVLNFGMGRMIELTPSVASLTVFMPEASTLPTGGPYFYLYNASGSHSVSLVDNGGTSIGTLAAGAKVTMVLYDNGGTNTWLAF